MPGATRSPPGTPGWAGSTSTTWPTTADRCRALQSDQVPRRRTRRLQRHLLAGPAWPARPAAPGPGPVRNPLERDQQHPVVPPGRSHAEVSLPHHHGRPVSEPQFRGVSAEPHRHLATKAVGASNRTDQHPLQPCHASLLKKPDAPQPQPGSQVRPPGPVNISDRDGDPRRRNDPRACRDPRARRSRCARRRCVPGVRSPSDVVGVDVHVEERAPALPCSVTTTSSGLTPAADQMFQRLGEHVRPLRWSRRARRAPPRRPPRPWPSSDW